MPIDKQFEKWMRARHLKECAQCQKEGKARLMDCDAVAVYLFKTFYEEVILKS